jgi:SAM-dependent methyltransferase
VRPRTSLADLWAEAEQRLRDNPEMLAYVKNCAALLKGIVTGRASALESLFPGGSWDLATGLYERSSTMRYINGVAAAALDSISRSLPAGRMLRVLEIGAGTGGTSSSLLPVLPADRTDYLFTDVSDAFLDRARSRFAPYPQVRYGLYDLEKTPVEQGYSAGQFDVIVSANCVHASSDLRAVLKNLRSMLAPGGLLVLVESTVHFDYFDMTTGLIEGWQAFADDLRTDNPLIAPELWTGAMRTAGFDDAASWPPVTSPAHALGQHVIVARAPGQVPTMVAATVRSSETAVASTAPVAAVQDDIRARLLAETPSERQGLLEAYVSDAISTLLRRDADDPLDRKDRLMERGLDSLMAVQLRGKLSKTFALEPALPATLIFEHPTVEAIARHVAERLFPAVPESAPVTPTEAAVDAPAAKRLEEVREMSDAEIAALLEQQYGSAPHRPDA